MHQMILATGFFDTDIGKLAGSFMKSAAVVIVLLAILKGIKDVHAGKTPKAVGMILGAAAFAVFLWDPALIDTLLTFMQTVMDKIFSSGTQLSNQSGGAAR